MMTLQEFYNRYVAIIEKRLARVQAPLLNERLNDLKAAGPSRLREFAQPLLNEVPALPATVRGSCVYEFDNQTFCLENVTRNECDDLDGDFTEDGSCPVVIHYTPETVADTDSSTTGASDLPDHGAKGAKPSTRR